MLNEFVQQIEETAQEVVDNIHTAMPGKIVSFDPAKCLAKVKPIGRFLTPDDELMDYPVITDVPVIFQYSEKAKAGVFFPVKKGDGCLLVISETELDEWRTGAVSDATLRFDLTSAIAIPGLANKGAPAVNETYSDDAVMVVSGNTKIKVSKEGVEIKGNVKINGNISCTGEINSHA